MTGTERRQLSVIEWGSAGAALAEEESGDLLVVAPFPNGALVAVIDGLGHGSEAAEAATAAAGILEVRAGDPVVDLVQRCHEGIRKTRGVVMSLASFNADDSSITWVGVGNVDGELLRAERTSSPPREAIATRGGVVGYQLPPLRATRHPVSVGDMLVMATDGVRSGFAAGLAMERGPQAIAESILARYSRGSDDALVLVARYLGRAA
jgi:hypothetical protein